MSFKTTRLFSVLAVLAATSASANVVGTDAQNFNPTTNGLDFVTVQSSETLKPGVMNFGFYANNAWNALPRFKNQPSYRDRLLGLDLNFGLGLAKNWDMGASLPSAVNQSITTQSGFTGRYSENGVTEVKLNSKFRLFGEDNGGLALVGSANFNLIENNPYVGRNSGPTYNIEAVYDRTFGKVAAALNVGYRIRDSGTALAGIPIKPFGNQYIASVAGNYRIEEWDSKLIAEIFGSVPTSATKDGSDRQASSLEALLGIKHDFTTNLAGHFGFGRELIGGVSSPDFRVYTGINFQFGPVFGGTVERIEPGMEEVAVRDTDAPSEETFTLRKIPFDFNSAALSPTARPILDELAKYLRDKGFASLTIEGHTDSIGKDSYNLRLSQARAESIRNDLIKTYKFAAAKISAAGFGESQPIADNGNYQGREENRRVEFKITRTKETSTLRR